MEVIGVLNQKGGVGKTTIAVHLARALQLDGDDVLLVDSDPQGNARDWAALNESQAVTTVGIDRPTIDRDLPRVSDVDYAVLDGVGKLEALTVSALKASTFVLIPVGPSPLDLWAASDFVDLVKQRIDMTDGRVKAAFVVSMNQEGTILSREIEAVLEGYELPILETRVARRAAYPKAMAKGLTTLDTEPSSAASAEIRELAAEIKFVLAAAREGVAR